MRDRYLSVGDQIVNQLTQLNWHMERAPASVRASVRSAAAEIVSAQERLRQQMRTLPADPEQRSHVMRNLLQVQFGALMQLTGIVEKVAALTAKLPATAAPSTFPAPLATSPAESFAALAESVRQLAVGYGQAPMAPPPWPAAGYGEPALPSHLLTDEQEISARLRHLVQGEQPIPASAMMPWRPPQRRFAAFVDEEGVERKPRRLKRALRGAEISASAITSRRLVLMMTIASALAFGYFMFPRVNPTRVAEKTDLHTSAGEPVVRDRGSSSEIVWQPAQARSSRVPSAPVMSAPPTGDGEPNSEQQVTVPAQTPDLPKNTPRTASGGQPVGEQFVPVIYTHRDRTTVLGVLADMKKQYPSLLAAHKGEAQSIDLGNKGVWYRLVLLPAGSQAQATNVCDQFRAVGYERCWVKGY